MYCKSHRETFYFDDIKWRIFIDSASFYKAKSNWHDLLWMHRSGTISFLPSTKTCISKSLQGGPVGHFYEPSRQYSNFANEYFQDCHHVPLHMHFVEYWSNVQHVKHLLATQIEWFPLVAMTHLRSSKGNRPLATIHVALCCHPLIAFGWVSLYSSCGENKRHHHFPVQGLNLRPEIIARRSC